MRVSVLIYCFILLLGEAYGQEIKIKIVNKQQNPIENATVKNEKVIVGHTNQLGEIRLYASQLSNKILSITAVGYKELHTQITVQDGQEEYLQVLEEKVSHLDEVVITAGRKPEHISTVPSSITILNQKDIEAQGRVSTNLASILGNTVPGLGVSTNKANNSGQTLRGRQVLVLIDGIPQSTPLMNGSKDIRTIDPGAIERIEVIKGATSIYGNGSGGGIINYITRKNLNEKAIGGTTNIASTFNPAHTDETYGYRVSQNIYGVKNKWNYAVGGTLEYTGLQRDSDGIPLGQVDGLSDTRSYNAFVKLGYELNPTSSLNLFYNYFGSNQHAKYISQNGKYGETPTIGVEGEEPGKPSGTPYNHNGMLSYHNANIIATTSLDATLYFNKFSSMNRYVASGTAWYGAGQTMIKSDKKGLRINFNTPIALDNVPIEITYGLDVLNDVTYQDLVDGRVYIPKLNMVNIAPYAQLRIDFFEHMILKAGVRYENASVNVKDFNTIATGPNNEGSIFVSGGTIPYKATMFNAGLRYNKYAYFNPFVSFSQGFAINELGRILRRAKENTLEAIETDPIITNNYEAGFSSRFQNLGFSFAYYISTSKLGVNLVDVGGFLMPQREPERVNGFEISLDYDLLSNFQLGGSYAYVEGKAEFDNGEKVYLNGSRIAPAKATAYLNYNPSSKMDIQLSWTNTGARDRFDKNDKGLYNNSEGPVKSVDLFNLSAGYAINTQWKVGLGVENLFNKSYYPVVSQYRALDADYVRGNGISSTLSIGYKF